MIELPEIIARFNRRREAFPPSTTNTANWLILVALLVGSAMQKYEPKLGTNHTAPGRIEPVPDPTPPQRVTEDKGFAHLIPPESYMGVRTGGTVQRVASTTGNRGVSGTGHPTTRWLPTFGWGTGGETHPHTPGGASATALLRGKQRSPDDEGAILWAKTGEKGWRGGHRRDATQGW